MLGVDSLAGKTFLDVGSGSGLFSLAARLMGASVRSFDYDPQSVTCTKMLRERFCHDDPMWIVEEASVLDRKYLQTLGQFDVVSSWGGCTHGCHVEAPECCFSGHKRHFLYRDLQ
jgi:2-polyprenyl-6-hydroxyphenyl methylase/3-demethylubiquinone-9 3-methyltransferase